MFEVGQRVVTEFGAGTVTHSSSRRVVVELDHHETINVATGTFGYDRIKPLPPLGGVK